MKELKINKKIEQQVEQMVIIGANAETIKKEYPACWNVLKNQHKLDNYYSENHVIDDIENVKIRLYAEIVKQNKTDRVNKEKKIQKQLKKIK